MTKHEWQEFLAAWAAERRKVDQRFVYFYGDAIKVDYVSLTDSAEIVAKLAALEIRLGVSLPSSFKSFLEAGGDQFEAISFFYYRSLSIKKIHWLSQTSPNFFAGFLKDTHVRKWRDRKALKIISYRIDIKRYGQIIPLYLLPEESIRHILKINDSIWLNPAVKMVTGEWEAWYFDSSAKFIIKYPSFTELIQALYKEFLTISKACWLEPHYQIDSKTGEHSWIYPWQEFIQMWSEVLLSQKRRIEFFSTNANLVFLGAKKPWIGFPPATETMLEAAEARFGVKFPPSYRQFLALTNGFPLYHQSALVAVLPLEKIRWWREDGYNLRHWQDTMATFKIVREGISRSAEMSDKDYFDYASRDSFDFRLEHALATLKVGDFDGNECYLLNPLALNEAGEWEAWFQTEEGEVSRYPSFWHMMQEVYYRMFILS